MKSTPRDEITTAQTSRRRRYLITNTKTQFMKRIYSLLALLLALMFSGKAEAQTTTLLEYGTSGVAWSADKIAEWTAGGTPTLSSDGTYVGITGGNGSYATSTTITPTENAILNIKAVWRGRSNTGRAFSAGNGSYFRFGNIIVAQNDQDKKHGYGFSGLTNIGSVTTFTAGSYRVDIDNCTWLLIEMEINTATNTLTSFYIKSEDGNTTYVTASDVVLTDADYTNVAFGYRKTGSVSYANAEQLKSIEITQTVQSVTTANYTIKYVDGLGASLKDDVVSASLVGQEVTASETQLGDIYVNDKKYIYESGNNAITLDENEANNVITLVYREAQTWSYTLNAVYGEAVIETLATGSVFEGESKSVTAKHSYLAEGTLVSATFTGKDYNTTVKPTEDNYTQTISYTATETTGVVFFSEAEDIITLTPVTSGYLSERFSGGKGAYAAETDQVIATLQPGKYKLTAHIMGTQSVCTFTFKAGDATVWENATSSSSFYMGNGITGEEFTITTPTDIILVAAGGDGSGSKVVNAVDFIYIQKTGDVTPATYAITCADAENGTVAADVAEAAEGATVTLTITPASGYELDALTVMNGETAVEVTNNTFVMPSAAVTVTATFKQTVVEPEIDDVIENADFSLSTPLDNHLCGYGKDMAAQNTTYYGMQDVTGWDKVILASVTDGGFENSGLGGGVFAYGSEWQMKGNNKSAPAAGPDGEAGNALGFFAVWGNGGYYSQKIKLAAGEYTLKVPIYNQSGTQANTSYTGFFVDNSDVKYTVDVNPAVGSWAVQTVTFELTEETTGEIRLGYQSTGGGSGANQMIFFDGVTITTPLAAAKEALDREIKAAEKVQIDYPTFTKEVETFEEAITAAKNTYNSEEVTAAEVNDAAATMRDATTEFVVANMFTYQKYLIKNVASGMYWGAANDWGTQASLVPNAAYVKLDPQPGTITYHLESQVNNGGTQYYFNGDYMDNGSPVELTVKEVSEGKYTIANGDNYYGWDGTSTVLGKNLDATSDNALWTIVSIADAKEALVEATPTTPIDATFLIEDHNFGRNNRYVNRWIVSDDCTNKNLSGGNNINNCAESYHSTFTISQTVENVPAGVYAITAQGFYRQDDGMTEDAPVFFINDETATVPVKTGEENNMNAASESFSAGYYTIKPVFAMVGVDGTLTVGVKGTATNQWVIFDNFTLTYYGEVEPGDVNCDNETAISDVTLTVNFALGKKQPTAFQKFAADRTKDGAVAVEDAVDIVNIIMDYDYSAAVAPAAKARESETDMIAVNGNQLSLTNSNEYVAFQMDINVDGQFNGAALTERAADHQIVYNKVGENTWRIIGISMANKAFNGNAGALVNFDIDGTYTVSTAKFITLDTQAYYLNIGGEATGISSVSALNAEAKAIYTPAGVRVNSLQKGLNIVRKADGTTVKVFVK